MCSSDLLAGTGLAGTGLAGTGLAGRLGSTGLEGTGLAGRLGSTGLAGTGLAGGSVVRSARLDISIHIGDSTTIKTRVQLSRIPDRRDFQGATMTSTSTTSAQAAAAAITSVTLEVPDPDAAGAFYRAAFGLGTQVRLRASQAPTTGFRGFTLSLVVSQPSTVDSLVATALDAGATMIEPVKKSFWG